MVTAGRTTSNAMTDDFKAPYGLAYRDGFVLVADQDGIWRVPHVTGAVRAGRPDEPKITDVPPEQRKPVAAAYGQELITQRGVFGIIAGHQNRHLALDPKTGAMFVGVGSTGNIGVEPEVKASIQRFEPDGSGQSTFASGMRNLEPFEQVSSDRPARRRKLPCSISAAMRPWRRADAARCRPLRPCRHWS